MNQPTTVQIEIIDTATEFKFRLISATAATCWVRYSGVAYLAGYCAATQYSLSKNHALTVMTLKDFADNSSLFTGKL